MQNTRTEYEEAMMSSSFVQLALFNVIVSAQKVLQVCISYNQTALAYCFFFCLFVTFLAFLAQGNQNASTQWVKTSVLCSHVLHPLTLLRIDI